MSTNVIVGELGVTEHHEKQLLQFLRTSRYARAMRLKAVQCCFDDTKKSRLNDSTYTRDEMCGQAEKWYLKLFVNMSELEDRELLDAVLAFEEQYLSETMGASKRAPLRPQANILRKLEPIETNNASVLLETEIGRLRAENDQLKKQIGGGANKIAPPLQLPTNPPAPTSSDDKERMAQLEKSIAEMRDCMLNESTSGKQIATEMQEKLIEAHKRLLDVQAQLHSTESELEKKFSQTAAYKNMKQILNKKNKQMKELRTKLVKYEPNSHGGDSGEEEED